MQCTPTVCPTLAKTFNAENAEGNAEFAEFFASYFFAISALFLRALCVKGPSAVN
jgi:hypothetical protein